MISFKLCQDVARKKWSISPNDIEFRIIIIRIAMLQTPTWFLVEDETILLERLTSISIPITDIGELPYETVLETRPFEENITGFENL